MKKTRKSKKLQLKGNIATGALVIGDIGYFAANPQDYEGGVIPTDPANPFKDGDKALGQFQQDKNLELPGSVNGDLLGRGVVINTNMLSGAYTVKKQVCKITGKLKSVRIVFKD